MRVAMYARVSRLDQEPDNQLRELRRYVAATEERARVSHRADQRVRRQQCLAATGRAAHNLLTNFQIDTDARERTRSRKHTVLHLLQTVQTLRFEVFHRAALLVRPGGVAQLRLADNPATRQRFSSIEKALARAA